MNFSGKSFWLLCCAGLLAFTLLISCGSKGASASKDDNLPEYIDDGRERHADIEFDTDFVDLGTIKHGEVVTYTYELKNIGNIPLLINDVIAGCGCTSVNLSKEVLKPQEKGSLEVVFDSRGWYGSQFKSVTLVSNAITTKRSVTLKVNIVK